jgi:hypothetical protein
VLGPSDSGGGAKVLGAVTRAAPNTATVKAQSDFRLPLTGGDFAGLVLLGIALGGVGIVVVRLARRVPSQNA